LEVSDEEIEVYFPKEVRPPIDPTPVDPVNPDPAPVEPAPIEPTEPDPAPVEPEPAPEKKESFWIKLIKSILEAILKVLKHEK
jgi:hypothetical protein